MGENSALVKSSPSGPSPLSQSSFIPIQSFPTLKTSAVSPNLVSSVITDKIL